MPKKKEEEGLNEEHLALLNENYPVSGDDSRPMLPRFGMLSKDIVEVTGSGKTKKINVIQSAGTFYVESDKGETDATGKKVWTKDFIDSEEVDVNIVYHRYQLRKYDSGLEKFYSTPIYDNAEQVLPLYLDKQVVKRGTEAELQKLYPALTQKGKPTSDLKKECILYVIYEGVLHQFNISQSSKWEFMSYKKKVNPSTVITTLSSKEETFGDNTFRKTMFTSKRPITNTEVEAVIAEQTKVKDTVQADGQYLLQSAEAEVKFNKAGKSTEIKELP